MPHGHGCETRCFSIKNSVLSLGRNHGFKEVPFPYHPCMVYLPTWMVDFYGTCRQICHTWMVWDFLANSCHVFHFHFFSFQILFQKLFHHSRFTRGEFRSNTQNSQRKFLLGDSPRQIATKQTSSNLPGWIDGWLFFFLGGGVKNEANHEVMSRYVEFILYVWRIVFVFCCLLDISLQEIYRYIYMYR